MAHKLEPDAKISDAEFSLSPKEHDNARYNTEPRADVLSEKEHVDDSPSSDNTGTNSSDEFDWDKDEESPATESRTVTSRAKRGRALYLAFLKLARPIRTLLVGILGCSILITPLIVVHLKFRNNAARPHVRAWSIWLSIVWAAACLTNIFVDAIPRMAMSITMLFGGHVQTLKTQLELCLAASGWIKLALDISWAWIALAAVRAVYNPPGDYWHIVNLVMQALFAAGLIVLVEKLILHFIAINFHQKALADRLAENRLGLKALDRLSNAQPAPRKIQAINKGHKSPSHSNSASVDLSHLQRRPQEGIDGLSNQEKADDHSRTHTDTPKQHSKFTPRQKRKKAMASVIVDHVGGVIGKVALKNSDFNREGDGSLHSARRLAKKLFQALSDVYPPRSHLIVTDFEPYFRTTAEAHAAFATFDKDNNGDISKKEMREAVQRIYRERKDLIASLKDVSAAVGKLDAVLLGVAVVGIIFVTLLIFNRNNTLASLVPLATIILGFSFIFGHSAQTLFESLIFIFSTHVFDVGDVVMIDDQPLVVREFGLFSTTFRRVDGFEIIAPNAILASSKLIHNLRRSGSMWETTNLMVSYNTPLAVIEQLRSRISAYVTQNNREWNNSALNIDKMEFQNAIHLIVAMEHRPNWQDWGGRWARRTAFMRNLKVILEELDIRYTMPVQPVLLPTAPPFVGRGNSDLGNAGFFQGAEMRAPARSLTTGGDRFGP